MTGEEDAVKHGPYRAYVRTTPQYIPSHGVRRYKHALKSLIPVRRVPRFVYISLHCLCYENGKGRSSIIKNFMICNVDLIK